MDALLKAGELDVPKALVESETERMVESARADLKQRGIKDAENAPIPDDVFRPQAERRVRLGLVVAELVRAHNLQATAEQIKKHIEELASSYEKPADVVRWYYSDNRRLAEVEAIVIEANVTNHVMTHAKVTDVATSFEELMGQNA
jgi:trigger factor